MTNRIADLVATISEFPDSSHPRIPNSNRVIPGRSFTFLPERTRGQESSDHGYQPFSQVESQF